MTLLTDIYGHQVSPSAYGLIWSKISTDTQAVSINGYLTDTTSQAITITLPDTPVSGDSVGVSDAYSNAGTNNITIDPNGNKILSSTENLVIDIDGAGFILVYVDSTVGWTIVSEINRFTQDLSFITGPSSSLNNSIVLFDGTDGETTKDSLVTVDASGSVNIPSGQTYNINGFAHTHDLGTGLTVEADGTLSGAPIVVSFVDNGTTYYFKAYPTKS